VAETTPPRLFPQLTASDRLLFYGDSVTQAGRDTANPTDLGYGYVADIAATLATDPALSGITVMNRGINGDGIVNLVYRFDRDCLALEPTIVTILIGVNDTMATTDWGNPVSLEQFEAQYRTVLSAIRDQIGARVVLMTPVLTPIDEKQTSWLPDLDARIDIVKRLAGEYGALLVDTNTALDQLAAEIGPWAVAEDGVHPGAQGAAALANAWIDAVAR
jgi:lysophospholipase L1-like esterase